MGLPKSPSGPALSPIGHFSLAWGSLVDDVYTDFLKVHDLGLDGK